MIYFDASKWGHIERFLADEGVLKRKRTVEPVEATGDGLLVVCSCDLVFISGISKNGSFLF
jgi:hypothetical protein